MPQVGLTKSAAQSLLQDYSSKIESAMDMDYAISLIKSKLEAQLKKIEEITRQAFSLLGYTGSIEANERELSANVKLAQEETASMNGNNLEQTFIRKFKNANPFKMDLQRQYDAIFKMIEQEVYGSDFFDNEAERAATIFMSIMQGTTINNGTLYTTVEGSSKVRESSTGKLVGYQYNSSYASLGKTAKDKVLEYCKDHEIELEKFQENYNDNSMTLTWLLKNIDVESFLKMDTAERERVLKTYPGLLDKINQIYKDSIIEACPGANKKILLEAINSVLGEKGKDTAFFVGGSVTQLTGILGEIQGVYIFRRIIKDNGKRSKVDWVGGLNNPHADLILRSALGRFGIQVKNTSYSRAKDELINIEFKDFNQAKSLIEGKSSRIQYELTSQAMSAASELGISGDIFDAIQSALAAETFNIYYKWNPKTKQAESVDSNEDFVDVRSLIEIYARKAEQIMSLYSAALMYMQSTAMTGNMAEANTFYLIAGATVVSAATIMSTIVQELESSMSTHFRVQVKTGHKSNKTIVDVLNSGKAKPKASVINFLLQSSYNF